VKRIALSIVLASLIMSPLAALSDRSPVSPICYEDGNVTVCYDAYQRPETIKPPVAVREPYTAEQVARARYVACFIAARYWHLDMSLCD
jgi:hypothetical protein